jgi:pyrimidine operon attenuation protein/uracil phosphoribosyltransferase
MPPIVLAASFVNSPCSRAASGSHFASRPRPAAQLMAIPPHRQPPHGAQGNSTRTIIERDAFQSIYSDWRDRIGEALALEDAGPPAGGPRAVIGIKRRGAVLARRIFDDLGAAGRGIHYGEVDISLYRDDYHLQRESPEVLGTEIGFGVEGTRILLVDDVLYTGRTVRAAMDLILDFGRPRVILLAVFVDRGHRELPIAANFIGKEVPTQPGDEVRVRLSELGEDDRVELITGGRSAER